MPKQDILTMLLDLVDIVKSERDQQFEIDRLRVSKARYVASSLGDIRLRDVFRKQDEENTDALIGEFDGFCYSSKRAKAKFRSLETMLHDGLITEDEYKTYKNM